MSLDKGDFRHLAYKTYRTRTTFETNYTHHLILLLGQPKQAQAICSPFNIQSLYEYRAEVIVMHMLSRQYACKTCARPVGKSVLLRKGLLDDLSWKGTTKS
jgi:hypothetical protein